MTEHDGMKQSLQDRLLCHFCRGRKLNRLLIRLAPLERIFTPRYRKLKVERPIFIIGVPRSGTSILYQVLRQHADLARLTHASDLFPECPIIANYLFRYTGIARFKPGLIQFIGWTHHGFDSAEGYNTWRYFAPKAPMLTAEDVTEEQRLFYQSLVKKHLFLYGRSRFMNKSPFHSLNIGYLDKIFPDALFIHIYRDGRAVARSIQERRMLYGGPRAVFGPQPPELSDIDEDTDPLVFCGLQWKYILKHIRDSLRQIPQDRQFTLSYEYFTQNPLEASRDLLRFCGLDEDDGVIEASNKVSSKNFKWRDELSDDTIAQLNSAISDALVEWGYEIE
jgi:hypothetical protein